MRYRTQQAFLNFALLVTGSIIVFAVIFQAGPALIGLFGVFFVLMLLNRLDRKVK